MFGTAILNLNPDDVIGNWRQDGSNQLMLLVVLLEIQT